VTIVDVRADGPDGVRWPFRIREPTTRFLPCLPLFGGFASPAVAKDPGGLVHAVGDVARMPVGRARA